jgi:hypothetical protein
MAEASGTTNRYRSLGVVSAAWVLLMVAFAVARGGVVLWVRWTATAVAILIAILIVVGLVVLTRRLPRPPRPAGDDRKDVQTQFLSVIVAMSSGFLASGLGSTWQGDAPLLVLAGVLGSIPFLALIWWRVLRPNRTTDTGPPRSEAG